MVMVGAFRFEEMYGLASETVVRHRSRVVRGPECC
jgi:hypothetical protein